MYKSIKYQDNFYKVEGCKRSGFTIYEMRYNTPIF